MQVSVQASVECKSHGPHETFRMCNNCLSPAGSEKSLKEKTAQILSGGQAKVNKSSRTNHHMSVVIPTRLDPDGKIQGKSKGKKN